MKTNPSAILRAFGLGLLILCCSLPLHAEQFGLFRYAVNGGTIEVTDYPKYATGPVEIPALIAGRPVTSIGGWAFAGCTGLTSVTIPSSVTSIGGSAFDGCTGLTSINVEAGNTAYASDAGVLLNAAHTVLVQYPPGRAGSYSIPSSVTSIDREAFYGCAGLTSINISSSVTSIGFYPFFGCTGLSSINVEAGNPAYSSEAGVLLNTARTALIQCPQRKAGAYSIPPSVTRIGDAAFIDCTGLTSVTMPSGVTSIGSYAFRGCTGLTSVTIPSGVSSIGGYAFRGCTGLTSVTIPSSVAWIGDEDDESTRPAFPGCTAMLRMVILGNAPVMVSGEFKVYDEFDSAAPGFTIYYLSSRSGFTSPRWRGYSATMIDETTYPAAGWLLEHGLWYDTDLHTDSDGDGDGVALLMAYALDLDPRQNLRASLPVPVLSGNTLSLTFRATSPGVIYRAESSTGLTNWTTAGVTQSAPGPDGRSTASIPLDSPHRFLRLTVED